MIEVLEWVVLLMAIGSPAEVFEAPDVFGRDCRRTPVERRTIENPSVENFGESIPENPRLCSYCRCVCL
jgi:hypothetical protein